MFSPTSRVFGTLVLCVMITAAACSSGNGGSALLPANPSSSAPVPSITTAPWKPVIVEFLLPTGHFPSKITVGADNNLWFTEPPNHLVGRMNTSGSLIAEYLIAISSTTLGGIALGSDGNVWFTDTEKSLLDKITTSGFITSLNLATNEAPTDIINGPDNLLWFPVSTGFGKLMPTSTTPIFYTPRMTGRPTTLAVGPFGNIWFAEGFNARVGSIDTNGTGLVEFPLATATAQPKYLTAGPDQNMWVTEGSLPALSQLSLVSRFTLQGQETVFPTPTFRSGIGSIIALPNGFLYATESAAGNIARINPLNGHIDEVQVPSGPQSNPGGLVLGPDGNIWFTESGKIGRLSPP